MTPPKDRDALIEVIMRALVRVRVESNLRISDSLDRPGYTPEEIERSIDYALDPEVRDHAEWPAFAKGVLTALESSGCFVGPVVATPEMETAAQAVLSRAVGFTDYGGWTGVCRDQDEDSGQQTWTAMQSANPYRKE